MKKVLLLVSIIFVTISLFSQSKGTAVVSFSMFSNYRMLSDGENFPKEYGLKGSNSISFDAQYVYPLNSWLNAEMGLNYTMARFVKTDLNNTNSIFTADLLNLPIGFRLTFLKYGFVNSGTMLDLLYNPGFGSYFGGGIQFQSEYGFGMLVNPYIRIHSVVPFNLDMSSDRIVNAGIKIGFSYSIDYLLKDR